MWPCFNSILVQLEAGGVVINSDWLDEFQFHIGAIRRTEWSTLRGVVSMFQFHIGAIRSKGTGICGISSGMFQFHIGAIRRVVK